MATSGVSLPIPNQSNILESIKSVRGGPRKGAGRPVYQPNVADQRTVSLMSVAGIPQERIAACIGEKGISVPTLVKHFSRELRVAQDEIIRDAAGGLAAGIFREEPWAVCFTLKCKAGWQERTAVELSGSVSLDVAVLDAGRQRAYQMAKQIEGKK